MPTTAEKTKRLVVRNLNLTRRSPDPPQEVRLSENGDRLTWKAPLNMTGLTHFRVRIDNDSTQADPDYEVAAGQRSCEVRAGTVFYVSAYNSVAKLESKKVRVSARSTESGVEYAPNVLSLNGSVERRYPEGGNEEWRYALTWTEPTTDLRYRFVAAWVIYIKDAAGKTTRVAEVLKGVTAYISEWMAVPSAAAGEEFTIYVVPRSTLGSENAIIPGTTPNYVVTIAKTVGGSGVEYASNVTITGAATVQYPGKADGTYRALISIPFTAPSDARWGSCDMVALYGGVYTTLTKADSTTPCDAEVSPPDTVQSWRIYLVSRDTSGRRNSITASTPYRNVSIGSASGQLDGQKLIASSVSTVHLDAEGIAVGGGGGKPGEFAVYNASGTQIGFVGMDGARTGIVNTNGTAVTRVSGDPFVSEMEGLPISINNVIYTVSSVTNGSALVLTTSAGVQSNKAYIGWTGQGIWGSTGRFGGSSYADAPLRFSPTGLEIDNATIRVGVDRGTPIADNAVLISATDGILVVPGGVRGATEDIEIKDGAVTIVATQYEAGPGIFVPISTGQYSGSGWYIVGDNSGSNVARVGGSVYNFGRCARLNLYDGGGVLRHEIYAADGSYGPSYANFYALQIGGTEVIDASRNFKGGAAWDGNHVLLGAYHLWVDGSGRLRIKSGAPGSDTDGTVVGTQS